ncbi:MAG: DUF2892 domain-containing protein [Candidatus Peribacteria bacterium]|nr:MAG: DUF2892 domain-containing protein [Candidatus Peribacteria bacterium]
MQHNVGKTDKIIRVSIAIILLILVLTGVIAGIGMWIAMIAIIMLIMTSARGYCGIYSLLGMSTCPIAASQDHKGEKEPSA